MAENRASHKYDVTNDRDNHP